MTKYDADEVPQHDPSNSHSMLVELVGPDRRVLDVGCATGYVARALVANGCRVTGVDGDREALDKAADALERSVLADLDSVDLVSELGERGYDAIICGDVLEHLRDPAALLRQARRLLAPGGTVAVSIPNVTHGDVRLALFAGRWDYRPLGLLDATHLRFFSYDGVERLFADSGLAIVEVRRVRLPLFGTELGINEGSFDPVVVAAVRRSPEHDVYQFVVQAVPADADGVVAAQLRQRTEALERVQQQLAEARSELAEARSVAAAVPELQAAVAQSEAALATLRATQSWRYTAPFRAAASGLRRR